MKVCKLCGSTYGDRVDFCFKDGQPLVPQQAPAAAPPAPRARPGLADMLDVVEPAYLRSRGADPTALPDAADLPEASLPDPAGLPTGPAALSFADEADEVVLEDGLRAAPTDQDAPEEELPGPAALGGVAPAAVLDPVPGDEFVDGAAEPGTEEALADLFVGAQGEEPPDPAADAPTLDDLGVQDASAGPADDDPPDGADALPGPTSIDHELDPDALADLARTLGGPVIDESDAPTLNDAASASPALADLVEDAPEEAPSGAPVEMVIGVEPDVEGVSYVDEEPPPRRDNRVVYGLFAAAVLVAALAGLWVVSSGKDTPADPMASKPEERAAPVMAAPGLPAPTPAPAEAVAAAPPPEEPGLAPMPTADPLAAAPEGAPAGSPTGSPTATAAGSPTASPTASPAAAPTAAPTAAPAAAPAASAPPATTARVEQPRVPQAMPTTAPAATAPATAEVAGDPWQVEAATGRLTINTIPSGAVVYIDNRQYGPSPLSAELSYGVHTIRVELGGYSSDARTIDVQVPEMAVPFDLKPLVVTGTVNVFGPTGATVYVDGAQVGKIPTSVKLTEGAHSFRVETTDGTSFTRSQDIRFEGGSTISVTLSP